MLRRKNVDAADGKNHDFGENGSEFVSTSVRFQCHVGDRFASNARIHLDQFDFKILLIDLNLYKARIT